jgi:uncharacterized membrane protein YccC
LGTGLVREFWDRVVASDPGLTRLQSAFKIAASMASALGVEYLLALVTHASQQDRLVEMLLGAVVALLGGTALNDPRVWPNVKLAVFLPITAGIGLLVGVLVGPRTDVMLIVFVVVMFLAVFVRRFGMSFFFYGFMTWIGYFFAAFLHATFATMPVMISAVALGSAWVLLLSITVLRTNPTRTLRRIVRAYDAKVRAVARAAAELLETAVTEPVSLARRRRRLRARQHRLDEVALMVEAWSAEAGALPAGSSGAVLRRRLIDAQHAIDGLATAAEALTLASGDRQLVWQALPVLHRLARRDDVGANRAAHALAEAAEQATPTGPEREGTSGWWPARHLAVAAMEFVALVRNAGAAHPMDEVDEFSPAVTLALGNLPGSPAVARTVAARGRGWNPLARLDMTTRQAIQVAVAGTLAILVGRELSADRYYWAVVAAFIMFTGTGTRAETFLKGFDRVLGTLFGLFASIWLASVTTGNLPATLAAIIVSMFLGFYLIRLSYAYMIFFITIAVGQLYAVLHEFSDALLVLRLEETGIGAAVGLLVALFVLPLSTRDTVRTARDNLLTSLAELLLVVADRLDGTRAGEPVAALDQLVRGLDNRFRQLEMVARPLTRPLLWGNSPPRTRHQLALYSATATYARCGGPPAPRIWRGPAGRSPPPHCNSPRPHRAARNRRPPSRWPRPTPPCSRTPRRRLAPGPPTRSSIR